MQRRLPIGVAGVEVGTAEQLHVDGLCVAAPRRRMQRSGHSGRRGLQHHWMAAVAHPGEDDIHRDRLAERPGIALQQTGNLPVPGQQGSTRMPAREERRFEHDVAAIDARNAARGHRHPPRDAVRIPDRVDVGAAHHGLRIGRPLQVHRAGIACGAHAQHCQIEPAVGPRGDGRRHPRIRLAAKRHLHTVGRDVAAADDMAGGRDVDAVAVAAHDHAGADRVVTVDERPDHHRRRQRVVELLLRERECRRGKETEHRQRNQSAMRAAADAHAAAPRHSARGDGRRDAFAPQPEWLCHAGAARMLEPRVRPCKRA